MANEIEINNVSDTAYDATAWDGVTSIAPSKGAVRDKVEGLSGVYAPGGTAWRNGDASITIKPNGDTSAAIINLGHNDNNGYLIHLIAQANMVPPAALLALGCDTAGNGLLIANKSTGKGIIIDQQAGISSASAYGLIATQSSTTAPLVRLEGNVNGQASVLQLIQNVDASAGGYLLEIMGRGSGSAFNIGNIAAGTGLFTYEREIQMFGPTAMVHIRDDNGVASTARDHTYYQKDRIDFLSYSGSPSQWYPFSISTAGSRMFVASAAVGASDAARQTMTSTIIEFQHGKMAFFGAAPQARRTGWATVPTGTLTRTTFDTSTVTTAELAQRVAALIVDLHSAASYGLIGP